MTETHNDPAEAAAATSRDWARAAIWISAMLVIGIVAIIVVVNLMACGCGTRPAA